MKLAETIAAAPDLMEWFLSWRKEYGEGTPKYIYAGAAVKQVYFVRDVLAPLVMHNGGSIPFKQREMVELVSSEHGPYEVARSARVVSEHTSKSVRLPVYAFARPDIGLNIIMRNNFHGWKISVLSQHAICDDALSRLFITKPPPEPEYTGDDLRPVYFEGFDPDWCFGYQANNQCRWSAAIHGDYQLWATLFLIMNSLDTLPMNEYMTQKRHKEILAEQ